MDDTTREKGENLIDIGQLLRGSEKGKDIYETVGLLVSIEETIKQLEGDKKRTRSLPA